MPELLHSLVVHICTLFLIILVNLKFTESDLVRLFIYLNSTETTFILKMPELTSKFKALSSFRHVKYA